MNGEHTLLGDLDGLAKVSGLAIDFYSVMEELLKVAPVEDTIVCRLGIVNEKFVLRRGGLRSCPRL